MSAISAAPAVRAPGRLRRSSSAVVVGAALVVVVAFLVRLHLITAGAPIAGSDGYDDGVYYAAADALIHGRLPYRDFLFLHPPGIVLALTPFAALGSVFGDPVGVTVGRLVFCAIGAMNTALVMVIARRHSRVAAAVAGIASAVFFPLAYAERSTLLEPLGNALLLWSVVVLWRSSSRRGLVLAGVLAGCAVDVKIWYVVPVVVIGLLAAPHRRRFLLAAAAGAAVVVLPFLLADPFAMIREVVLDQLGRPASHTLHAIFLRVIAIGSDPSLIGHGPQAGHVRDVQSVLVLTAVAVAAVVAWRVRWARVFVVLTVVTGGVLLAGPSFFPHYVAYIAPWMLIVLGIGTASLTASLRRRPLRIAAALVPVVLVAGVSAHTVRHYRISPQPTAALAAVMASRTGCIVSDDPGLLADAGLLSPDLARGCPLWPDVTGWTYDRDAYRIGSHEVRRRSNPVWQRDLMAYLQSGRYVVLARRGTGMTAANRAELAEDPVIGRAGRLSVYATGH